MTTDLELLAESNREKARRTIDLVVASLSEYRPFDPAATYTPKDLEPYDALADRFVRAVVCCLRYFRSHELREFAEQSDSTRSLLNRMEKLDLVSNTNLWLQMRNVRNRDCSRLSAGTNGSDVFRNFRPLRKRTAACSRPAWLRA